MAFVGILSQIKFHFGPLVVQLVCYILKQLLTSVSVKVVDIYLHFGEYLLNILNFQNRYSLHLARKYARIFVRGHYLFRDSNSFPRA